VSTDMKMQPLAEVAQRIADLSPEKRELLERLLGEHAEPTAAVRRAPGTATESALAEVWAEVFGRRDIGIEEDFFELGGDSILSIQIVAKARERGLRLSPRQLFDHPCIEQLAAAVDAVPAKTSLPKPSLPKPNSESPPVSSAVAQVTARAHLVAAGIVPDEVEEVLPLSPIQQGMLYHVLSAPGAPLYFEQTLCTLEGELDGRAFEYAWQAAVARHPMLRTAFVWKEVESPVQVVYRSARLRILRVDWRTLSRSEQQSRYAAMLAEDRAALFDLAQPPQTRLILVQVDERMHWLAWSSYHLILDAWSLAILLREVFKLYAAARDGRPLTMGRAPSYGSFLAWLGAQDRQAAAAFWQESLRGLSAPTSIAGLGPAVDGAAGVAESQVELSTDRTAGLLARLRSARITLGTLAQAAWAALLHRYSGDSDLLFGMVVSGRPAELPGSETIVGPLLNTIPVRARWEPERTLRSFLEHIQQAQQERAQYELTPLVQIHQASGFRAGEPLFESILVVLNVLDLRKEDTAGLQITAPRATGYSNYPLVIRITPAEKLKVEVLYHVARYAAERAATLLTDVLGFLERIAHEPDATLADLVRPAAVSSEVQAAPDTGASTARSSGLAGMRPRSIKVSRSSLVDCEDLSDGPRPPRIYRPRGQSLDALEWAEGNRDSILEDLSRRGAVLLRGFHLPTLSALENLARSLCGELLPYRDRSTPRSLLEGNVYTSTEYPATETIALHNEFSYAQRWPMKIFFHCLQPPALGGETPIADCREVLERLDPGLRQRFTERRILYLRNYGQGIDLSWEEAFQTDRKASVEAYCRESAIDFEWLADNRLRTRQLRDCVAVHPATQEAVWFNQAHLFHVTNLAPAVRNSLLQSLSEAELPRNCYFGDGASIDAADLEAIRASYKSAERAFPWLRGDVLILDNMTMAHGRRPFSGARRIAVCMGEPMRRDSGTT
jgi:alpha-ketoglutarate-dependent taurine dioxygenase/aryl carrier-like protein